MGNSNFFSPTDPPVAMQSAMEPAQGFVTSLAGDPNSPPVAYRNPEIQLPAVKPQQNPLAELPLVLQQWLQSDAARHMVDSLRQKANRKAMGLEE